VTDGKEKEPFLKRLREIKEGTFSGEEEIRERHENYFSVPSRKRGGKGKKSKIVI